MKKIKKIKIGVGIVLLLAVGLFFHHTLPRTVVVQITGTDHELLHDVVCLIHCWYVQLGVHVNSI